MSREAEIRRVLVVDDNPAIHEDIRKILCAAKIPSELDALKAELLGEVPAWRPKGGAPVFEIESAHQGEAGVELARERVAGGGFALAFVDVRMPPGIDGVETTRRLWGVDPSLQVVLCTAYTDYSALQLLELLGERDDLVVLKKPFDNVEVILLAHALSRKWALSRRLARLLGELEGRVEQRTAELQEANERLQAEMVRRERVETELQIAHKLEAVGQLAAGIAHEINTPIQYVGDSVHFLHGAVDDLLGLVSTYRAAMADGPGSLRRGMEQAEQAADLDFLQVELPGAFERALEGLDRVGSIVGAMRAFAHPSGREMAAIDLNRCVQMTLTVARNEYKYVADVCAEYGDLPPVVCLRDELGQVFLNLIVNAAHAIEARAHRRPGRGRISIQTRHDGERVVVVVADDGCGIPPEARDRIFEPFFTTKPVGQGSGQGLAIARSIVVDRHGGQLTFESEEGLGTRFRVCLPVKGPPAGPTACP